MSENEYLQHLNSNTSSQLATLPEIPQCRGEFLIMNSKVINLNRDFASSVPDCSHPTDIILESSDRVRFGAHHADLAKMSPAFPVELSSIEGDVMEMPEDSDVLSLMLHYIHCALPQPDVKSIPWNTFVSLADAVEKYMISSATQVCKLRFE